MFRGNLIYVWVGVILLSGMFLLGQETWQPFCTDNAECGSPEEFCVKAPGQCPGGGICVPRPEACIEIYDPVCGCDGMTYGNDCLAACAGVSIAYYGECHREEVVIE